MDSNQVNGSSVVQWFLLSALVGLENFLLYNIVILGGEAKRQMGFVCLWYLQGALNLI